MYLFLNNRYRIKCVYLGRRKKNGNLLIADVTMQDLSTDAAGLRDQINFSPVTQSQHSTSHVNNCSNSLAAPEGFSSAFGLLSLDDANVLAGLSNDGVPFFTGAGMNLFANDNDPMSLKNAVVAQSNNNAIHNTISMNTPGSSRECETRELRDFWRAYMRTPLSGPGMSGFNTTPAGAMPSQNHTPSANGPRRARVSSLPSVKTPTAEMHEPHYGPKENGLGNNVTSSIRTTLHSGGGEDLRSYEAAVLARKAPLNLNLVARRRGQSTTSPHVPNRPFVDPLNNAGCKVIP